MPFIYFYTKFYGVSKILSDYDTRNAFRIEKYLSTNLKTRPDDVFDTFTIDLSGKTEELEC